MTKAVSYTHLDVYKRQVIGNVHDPSRQVVGGRGNLSFTSINLPRIGVKAHGDICLLYTSRYII